MTNYERIKSMTIEEMANDRVHWDGEYDIYYGDFCGSFTEVEDAIKAEIDWLMQEAEMPDNAIQVTVIVRCGSQSYRNVTVVFDDNATLAQLAPTSVNDHPVKSVGLVMCDGVAVADLSTTLKSVTSEVKYPWITGDHGRVLCVSYECTVE